MKVLGGSLKGGMIVELTRNEAKSFELLVNSMRGLNYNWPNLMGETWDEEPMEDVFYLIRHFAQTRFCIADFERSVGLLKASLLAAEEGRDD